MSGTTAEPAILTSIPSIRAWEATRAAFLRLHVEISNGLTAGTMPPKVAYTELAVLRGLYVAFQALSVIGHPDREHMRTRLHDLAERMTPASPPDPIAYRVESDALVSVYVVPVTEQTPRDVAYALAHAELTRRRVHNMSSTHRLVPVLNV